MPLHRWFSWREAANEILKCLDAEPAGFEGRRSRPGDEYEWILRARAEHTRLGQDLCEWIFPHLGATASKGQKSLRQRFDRDDLLSKAVLKAAETGRGSVSPDRVRGKLKVGAPYPTNFPPMVAQAIFERYTPPGGTIWDPCAGWGGRMLGALTSLRDYSYVATEVDPRTVEGLRTLGALIESVTGRCGAFQIVESGSEDYDERDGDVDFVFTSPPYFDVEDYGAGSADAAAQSHVKFPTRPEWVDGYVKPTVDNIAKALRPGGRAMINISDRTGSETDVVDAWVEASLDAGLIFEDAPVLSLTRRPKKQMQAQVSTKSSNGPKRLAKSPQTLADYQVRATHEPLLLFRRR